MASEKRLIDANALKTAIRAESWKQERKVQLTLDFIDIIIDEQPTVDAVEVVRCGRCKDWVEIEETGGAGYCQHPCWSLADEVPPIVQFADFCSYGERKDNE